MSELTNILSFTENYSILGDKDQVLQILLKNDEGIITKKQNIAYSSKNLEEYLYDKINENNILKENEIKDKGKLIKDPNLVYLKNKQMNFEFVALYNQGKLLKISPFLYKDLAVRFDRVLGFSKNIDLLENKDISNRINQFNKKQLYFENKNIYCLVNSNNDQFEKLCFNDILNKRDYLFITSQSNLFNFYFSF